MLVDSHCHLGDRAFAEDRAEVVARAWASGLGRLVVIGESRDAAALALDLAAADGRIGVAVGIHPHDARHWGPAQADWLRQLAQGPGLVALGEIGLDYHYDHSPREAQREAFETQLALAAELDLPVVIHAREADEDMAAMLRAHPGVRAVMHSFSSGAALWQAAVELGHYVSFSGMVTFKNWRTPELVRDTPADRLLVETDAPYLAPVPHRGKRNEPAYVRHVAEQVAILRDVPFATVVQETGANVRRFFRWPDDAGQAA